jgi:tetratricopeptide (TPR) repeat protein
MILKNKIIPFELMILSALFFVSNAFLAKPELIRRSDYLPPPKIISQMSAGFNVQLSDSFWIRALQDFDYCDSFINSKECKGGSWLFQTLDLSTELDPKFFEAFYYGALALTVIISDYEGATKLFDKGIEQFPNEWQLNYAAGYHAMTEEKDYAKAGKRYLAAADNGAPSWVRLLAGRMAASGGDKEIAQLVLQQMIDMSYDPRLIKRLKLKLEEMKISH